MKTKEIDGFPVQLLSVLDRHSIVSVTDRRGRITHVNDKFVEISGYSPEELLGKTHKIINSGYHSPEFFKSMWETLAKGQIWSGDIRNRCKDGSFYWVRSTIATLLDREGRPTGYISIRTDISDVKQAQFVHQSFISMDHAPKSIFVAWSDTLELVYLSQQALSDFGIKIDETVGLRLFDLNDRGKFHHEYFEEGAFLETVQPLVNGEKNRILYESVGSDGSPIEVRINLVAPKGERPRFVIGFRDITERKEADRKKSEFLNAVSHELRTPLTSLDATLSLMTSGAVCEVPESMKRLFSIAQKNSKRLGVLVSDLLDFQELNAGITGVGLEPIDIQELLEQAVENNREYAAQFGVAYSVEPLSTPIRVVGDRARLLQVMDNLMSNAAKFSDESNSAELAAIVKNGRAVISVTDHGIGIPEEMKDVVFERFRQVDASDTRRFGGTGLGLCIAKLIVEKHAGRIWFDSTPGKGSRFYFDLPLTNNDMGIPLLLQNPKVLVGDDAEVV